MKAMNTCLESKCPYLEGNECTKTGECWLYENDDTDKTDAQTGAEYWSRGL